MPVNDPIADLLTRFRNAQHSRRTECSAPWSRIKEEICQLLKSQGYIADMTVEGEKSKKIITVTFVPERAPLQLKRISTPGGRRYVGAQSIRQYLHGSSLAIISTSQGLLTGKQAKEKNIGGELICTIA